MKYSAKNPGPRSFDEWLALESEDWTPRYGLLRGQELLDVRQSLLQEQEHVCCYCGRGLSRDFTDSHIDHFRPQSRFNGIEYEDLTLQYSNFVLSCGPPNRNRLPSTCGDAKGSKFDLNAYIEPWDEACEQRFIFGVLGTIVPADPNDEAAKLMIQHLRLDDPSLVQTRREYLQQFERDIIEGTISEQDYADEILRLRNAKDGQRIAFSHAAARYLEEEFG